MKRACLLTLLLLTACAGQVVPTRYYLLRSDATLQSRPLTPSTEYTLGLVEIAPYIDQPGLVLEVAPGQVRPARNHHWAEPVQHSIRNLLQIEISRTAGVDLFTPGVPAADTEIEVHIDQLHGTVDGDALLVARWWLEQGEEIISSYQHAETRPLDGEGYGALAEAERALLVELARRIGNSIAGPE